MYYVRMLMLATSTRISLYPTSTMRSVPTTLRVRVKTGTTQTYNSDYCEELTLNRHRNRYSLIIKTVFPCLHPLSLSRHYFQAVFYFCRLVMWHVCDRISVSFQPSGLWNCETYKVSGMHPSSTSNASQSMLLRLPWVMTLNCTDAQLVADEDVSGIGVSSPLYHDS